MFKTPGGICEEYKKRYVDIFHTGHIKIIETQQYKNRKYLHCFIFVAKAEGVRH